MTSDSANDRPLLSPADEEELTKLVNAVALSDHSLTLFTIAPESAPDHPVVQQFKTQLGELDEPLQFLTFFYSGNSLFKFLTELDSQSPLDSGRRVILAFGLEQLPIPQLKQAMNDLNLGREAIFQRNLVLVFWLNRESFLDEFRRRAPDFWDWRGKVATFETHPPLNPLFYPYLEWLIAQNSYLKMSGVMQVNRQVDIVLDQIYVSLQAEWVEERSQSFRERITTGEGRVESSCASSNKLGEPDASDVGLKAELMLPEVSSEPVSRQRVTKNVDLAEAVRKQDFSVILGDPGAGKTTLLRYLARHFAIAHRDGNPTVLGGMQEDLGQVRLPILFRIADYAERLAKQPDLSLVDYLKQFYRQWERYFEASDGDAVANLLLDKMAAGDCLLLLDGLDEVFDQSNRVQVVQQIDRLVNDYRTNKFVITSRIAGYQEAALGNRFREFTITPMGNTQIQQFLERWCLAIEVAQRPEADISLHQRDAEREARGILDAIETKPGVKRFAANPLLLTILALIHRNGTQMPQRRVELYALATKTLIEDWQLGRNAPYGARQRQLMLVEEEVTALLAPLAFRMHEEKPSGLVTQAEVEEWLTPKMADLQGVDEPAALELVRQFLRKVRETTGLFVERAPAVYGFMHLTFEEYFAARHIADNEPRQVLAIIQSKMSDSRWEEPILLAISFLNAYFPQQSRILVESLFRDLIEVGDALPPKEKLYCLSSIKVNLVKIESKLSGKTNFKVFANIIIFLIQTLLIIFDIITNFHINRYIYQFINNSDYLGKLSLALQIVQDIELNIPQRLKLIRGLVAAKIIIDSLNVNDSFLSKIPDNYRQLFQETLRQVETLKQFSSKIQKESENFLNLGIAHSVLEYLKIVASNLLQREPIRSSAQIIFFEVAGAHANSLSENSDNIVDSLNLALPEKYQAVAYWQAGYAYQQQNKYEQAIAYYQQSREIYQKLGKETNVANLWNCIGGCYREWGKYEQAVEAQQQHLTLRQKLDEQENVASANLNLGRIYQAWDKYEQALAHYEQSRNLYQKLGKETNVANLWDWIAYCYREWGKYEQAVEAQQQHLTLRQKLDEQENVASADHSLAHIYQAWGKYEQALAHYEQSRNLYQKLGKETNVANLWNCIGGCYREWGKYEQAVEAQQQHLTLRQKLDEQENVASANLNLAHIYQAWDKYEQALAHYEQSRNLYQKLGKETNVANLWNCIGGCYREWGKYEQAVEAQQQHLTLRQKLDEQENVASADHSLAHIYQAWGKYEQALAHYEQSRNLYQKLGKETDVATLWNCIGGCYWKWGKYEQALEAQQQHLTILQHLNDQSKIARAYWKLGYIYQSWGKYAEALAHYQQSRDLFQQLDKESDVADSWNWIGDCYREWANYQQAVEAQQQHLTLRQKLDDQKNIAHAYWRLGRIYQAWGKYEQALAHYQQSRDLYATLDLQQNVANQLSWLAACYRESKDYTTAIEYYQNSFERHQALGHNESAARRLRQLSNTQRQLAKNCSREEATALLQQAEHHLQQAIQLDTAGDYRENLAYDHITLALLSAEHLRWLPEDDASVPNRIAQFEQSYTTGFACFTELGQAVNYADEALDIARAYLEISPLENLDRAEALAHQSLQTFQDFNRCKLEASACKLLGEIYLARAHRQESGAIVTASQFLNSSLHRYRELDLTEKAVEVEQLMSDEGIAIQQ